MKVNFNVTRFFAATTLFGEEGKDTIHFLCKWENAKENVEAYKMGIRNVYFIEEGLKGLTDKRNKLAGMCVNSLLKLNRMYHRDTGLYFLGTIEDMSEATKILETILDAIYEAAEN